MIIAIVSSTQLNKKLRSIVSFIYAAGKIENELLVLETAVFNRPKRKVGNFISSGFVASRRIRGQQRNEKIHFSTFFQWLTLNITQQLQNKNSIVRTKTNNKMKFKINQNRLLVFVSLLTTG